MTVAAAYAPLSDVGNGATKTFSVPWPFRSPVDVDVVLLDAVSGAVITPPPVMNGGGTYDYVITGTPNVDTGFYPIGSVVFNTAPPANMNVWRGRSTDDSQDKVLPTNGRFPAKSVEAALDRRTLVDQEQDALFARTVHVNPWDPAPPTWPPASSIANMYLATDATGKVIGVPGLPPSGPDLSNFLAIALGGTSQKSLSQFFARIISLTDFGGVCDGVTDDSAAWRAAMARSALQGGINLLVPGMSAIASAQVVRGNPIMVPSNTKIFGFGYGRSGIVVTGGSNVAPLFRSTNASNVAFEDMSIIGNGINTGPTLNEYGLWHITGNGATLLRGFAVRRCYIANCAQSYWIMVEPATTQTADIMDIDISHNYFVSQAGNNPGASDITVSSDMVSLRGVTTCMVRHARIMHNYCDAGSVKCAFSLWGNTDSAVILGNHILNAGNDTGNDKGGYAIRIYDDTYINDPPHSGLQWAPTRHRLAHNVIVAPRSCGVYCAGANAITIEGGIVSGQKDTTVGSLPYAGISFNGTVGSITGVRFVGCQCSMNLICPNPASATANWGSINVSNCAIQSPNQTGGAAGIRVSGFMADQTQDAPIVIADTTINMTGTNCVGVLMLGSASQQLGTVALRGLTIIAGTQCVVGNNGASGGSIIAKQIILQDLHLATRTNAGVYGGIALNTVACPLFITDVVIDGTNAAASGWAADFRSNSNMMIDGLTFQNWSGAGAFATADFTGCKGSMRGVQHRNCGTHRATVPDFGGVIPTWAADQGTFIQNLNPTGAGALLGWTNTNGSTGWTAA